MSGPRRRHRWHRRRLGPVRPAASSFWGAALVVLLLAGCAGPPTPVTGGSLLPSEPAAPAGSGVVQLTATPRPDVSLPSAAGQLRLVDGVEWSGFGSSDVWLPVDSQLVFFGRAVGHRDVGRWRYPMVDWWRADLTTASATRFPVHDALVVPSPDGRTLLAYGGSGDATVIEGIDVGTGETSWSLPVPGAAHADYLDDGRVVVVAGDTIAVFDPKQPPAETRSSLPSELTDPAVVAVGVKTVVIGATGMAGLVDPSTGALIGRPWPGSRPREVAARPGGDVFARVRREPGVPESRVELVATADGSVWQTLSGSPLTTVTALTWLSREALLIFEAETGTGTEARPLLLSAIDGRVAEVSMGADLPADYAVTVRQGTLFMTGTDGRLIVTSIEGAKP
jgi:hypothetical protein